MIFNLKFFVLFVTKYERNIHIKIIIIYIFQDKKNAVYFIQISFRSFYDDNNNANNFDWLKIVLALLYEWLKLLDPLIRVAQEWKYLAGYFEIMRLSTQFIFFKLECYKT